MSTKRLVALMLTLCMVFTTVFAFADVATLTTEPMQANGTISGAIDAEGKFYADYSTLDEALEAGARLQLQMSQEGTVLLKNEGGALPLAPDERDVTLLGLGVVDFVRAGGGSGAASGTVHAMDWFDAFAKTGFHVNPKTRELYENLFVVLGGAQDANDSGKLLEPDMSYYAKSVTSTFKAYGDVGIIFISRFGRENIDLKTNNVPGHADPNDHYLQLEDNEKALVKLAKEHFDKVVVVLNSSSIMEIPELDASVDTEYGVDAILWVGGVGDQGTLAAAQILTGEVNPSGHTSDIWYADFSEDPTWTNWSDQSQNIDENGNRMTSWMTYPDGSSTVYSAVEFREGIYYGYRYYETKADDMNAENPGSGDEWYDKAVLYPFGHGLSYSTFDWELVGVSDKNITAANQVIAIEVKVTNTDDVAGKDVVQLYYTAPYTKGGIEKSSVVLGGFGKTRLLNPGESDTVRIELVAQDMASFDWDDANGNDFYGYELEAGTYVISARRSSHEDVINVEFNVAEGILCKTDLYTGAVIEPVFVDDFETTRETLLDNMISRATGLKQPAPMSAEDLTLEDWEAAVLDAQEVYYPYMDEPGQPWYVSDVPENWTQGVPTDVTLADLAGKYYTEPTIVDGVATAAEDENSKLWDSYMNSLTWEEITKLNISGEGGQDGPVQIGGTCWQSAPITAATFSHELLEEQGLAFGNQALLAGTYAWRGPGSNIHRTPFNGRTFEYYSEDPYMSAVCAATVIAGGQSKGLGAYLKHSFANVQEHNRADYGGVCTFATEQVFREIYMKSFQAAIQAGHSTGMMTSFNRLGYVVNSNHWAFHETVLRGEWGFKGSTINDMWAKDFVSVDLMMRAGDDVLMGTNSSFPKNAMTLGQWDAAARDGKGCVLCPTEDGEGMFVSTTHYYACRKSAQRLLQSMVNSNKYKNFATDYELSATVYYGMDNEAQIICADTSDFSVSVPEGAELPAGLSVDGFVVSYTQPIDRVLQPGDEGYEEGSSGSAAASNTIYAPYLPLGTYEMTVDMACDGYINVSGVKLTVTVVSPFQVNGENVTVSGTEYPVITLKAGEAADILFDSKPYAYQAMWGSGWSISQITNYYGLNGSKYLRNEEKTHADGTTIAYEDAQEKYELFWEILDDLPAGLTAEVQYGTAYGLRTNKPFEIVTGIKLVGTPTEPGTYTITVTESAPVCSAMAGIWLSPSSILVTNQTFTIVVE